MTAITSELTQKILKDITTTDLSSYQIAFKYQVNKMVVDSIGKRNLGEIIYNKKESLAYQKLMELIADGLRKGNSIASTADNLGVCRSTMFKLARSLMPHSSNQVQVISVEHPEQNMPVSDTIRSAVTTDVEEDRVERTAANPVVRNSRMPVRYRPYQSGEQRFHRGGHTDYARIVINGIQLSFNPSQENIFNTVNRIIEFMKTEG